MQGARVEPWTLGNADNNNISGVLNLGTWLQHLKAVCGVSEGHSTSNCKNRTTELNQFFSFVNNKISSIEPSAGDFQTTIERLRKTTNFNQSGILLGGNPYCIGAKRFAQRYLCRSSVIEIVHFDDVEESNKTGIMIGSVLGGGFLLLCFVSFILVIWKQSKKIYILKMVEQELTNRKVQPPFYSYNDLKLATNNFHNSNCLGRGGFGAVYKGNYSDGATIAVKRLFNSKRKQVLDEFLNEVVLITGIQHKNLIRLKGCCIENQERILVYGYAENGNVEDALWGEDAKCTLKWSDRYKICVGVASGLTYLHEELQPRIIHRDIKPANVLLDKNLNPKIADFGLAKGFVEEIDEHVTLVITGTRGYFAPEYFSEGRLTTKVDVFSYGIVVLEMVSGRKCFDPRLPQEEIHLKSWAQKLQRAGSTLRLLDPAIQTDYSEEEVLKVINIALMCVRSDPELRPTMSEVEIMLLEGQKSVYDILSTIALEKGESNSSLDKIDENWEDGMRTSAISTSLLGRGSSGVANPTIQYEENSLLYGQNTASDLGIPVELTSTDTREEYFSAQRSIKRSFSEKIRSWRSRGSL